VGKWVAFEREQPPGHAPSIFAQLRLSTGEIDTGLVPICDPSVGIGGVDWNPDLIEFGAVSVAIFYGGYCVV
jgi:hypothetical protein